MTDNGTLRALGPDSWYSHDSHIGAATYLRAEHTLRVYGGGYVVIEPAPDQADTTLDPFGLLAGALAPYERAHTDPAYLGRAEAAFASLREPDIEDPASLGARPAPKRRRHR